MDESERTSQGLSKFQQGIDLDAEGKTAEAIELYREAVQLCPEMPQAYYNLGVDLAMQGQSDQAIRAWRRAVWLKNDYRYELMTALDIDYEIRETEIMPCACPTVREARHDAEDRH
ncbi:MAG TPA: tetratricopeptide repeat protein [Candidatus Ozemobacteraceae bacterium]|nr:tetratricopeptide repeat protein [Candidatus Ozemobacteraceae bacterium]